MGTATLRFYASLNDFLPSPMRHRSTSQAVHGKPAVKDLIESVGVPHPEIGLILIHGRSVGFGEHVQAGDYISVFPFFTAIDVASFSHVLPPTMQTVRFLLDVHLGRLARLLRLCGFDAAYSNHAEDSALALKSSQHGRVLLTRDRSLLMRNLVHHGYCVRSAQPRDQCVEVLRRFGLGARLRPLRRCLACNGLLEGVSAASLQDQVPADVLADRQVFTRCPGCGRVYWMGSHMPRLLALVESIRGELQAGGPDGGAPGNGDAAA